MSSVALIRAMDSLKKREGDLPPTLKTIFFEGLKNKYKKQTIKEILTSYKGGSWGSDYFKESIKARVLRSPDIRFGFIDVQNAEERYFTNKEFENFSLKNNDILVIKSNGSLDLVGKSQIYKEDKNYPFVIASNFLMVLTPNQEKIYPEYLDLFLKSPESLVWRFDTQKTTTGLRNLNSTAFLNIEIPVPDSIEEQRTLFESFQSFLKGDIPKTEVEIKRFYSLSLQKEELSNELKHQLTLVKKLRQQLLQDAMQGNLVEQNKKDEPASELLKKIKTEKEKLKKVNVLEPFSENSIPYIIPNNWIWCKFGEVIQMTRGKFSIRPRNDPSYFGGGYPFIQIGSLDEKGSVINEAKQTLNEKGIKVSKKFPKNTIAIAIVGGTIGNLGVLGREMYFTDSIIGILPNQFYNQDYILNYLRYKQSEIKSEAYQMAGQPNIKIPTLENLLFPMPPLKEQNRIVQKLDELMQYCNELEASIKQSKLQNEKLLQQILREALNKSEN